MVITGRSTTTPTKLTVPASGAVTGTPSSAAPRSTPRCPLIHGLSGGSNARSTPGLGARGHSQDAWAGAGATDAGTTAGRSPGSEAVPVAGTSPAGLRAAGSSRTAASNAGAFICPASRRLSGPGRGHPGYVENGPRRPPGCPSERGACSTLDGAVCCALNVFRVSGEIRLSARCQHVSFRGAGEQWLTTRIQPSSSVAPRFRVRRIAPPAVRAPRP